MDQAQLSGERFATANMRSSTAPLSLDFGQLSPSPSSSILITFSAGPVYANDTASLFGQPGVKSATPGASGKAGYGPRYVF